MPVCTRQGGAAPPRFSGKNKLEIFKRYNSSSGSSSSSRGRKSCSVNQIIVASAAVALLVPMPPTSTVSSTYTNEINTNSGSINDGTYPNPALLSSNWSPLDDGIEVLLPLGERQKNPWKEDLEAEIQKALYGTEAYAVQQHIPKTTTKEENITKHEHNEKLKLRKTNKHQV